MAHNHEVIGSNPIPATKMTEEIKTHRRIQLIATVMQQILRDPEATIPQKLEAAKFLERHAIERPRHKGNVKNLRNQPPKKIVSKRLLGEPSDEGSN